ncbi:hypothetical protein [Amycolatopsis sp. RTGN1]|uniref:hypothetical protein n=1 Tax=Amycolatopsis ponsaeliensis TaxID=2992142 RepID=UPI00254ACB14|nr:hypothetical protein [Amycolatopsis sp. RTGN1]
MTGTKNGRRGTARLAGVGSAEATVRWRNGGWCGSAAANAPVHGNNPATGHDPDPDLPPCP